MLFDFQPQLQDETVRLDPLRREDFEALYAVAADPLIWEQHPNPNRYQREVFANFFTGAMESGGAFMVRDNRSAELIGSSRYYDLDETQNTVSIGYTFLARQVWSRGYNEALKALMLGHAFDFVGRVVFQVGEHNLRSRKAMEKLGAVLVGTAAVAYFGERSQQNVIYAIDKADWISGRPR